MPMDLSLTVIPNSVGGAQRNGNVVMDKKFVAGMSMYREFWDGPVKCVLRPVRHESLPFSTEFRISDLPFDLQFVDGDEPIGEDHVKSADVVLAGADNFRHLHISALCRDVGVPCVYGIEYTLKTRLQIIALGGSAPFARLKSQLWSVLTERKRRRAFRIAAGLQANGVPAYQSYKSLAPDVLLYFDTRMSRDLFADEGDLSARFDSLDRGKPLRLLFSGRLEPLKGVDHLVPLAGRLREAGVPFELDIYGTGNLETQLKEQISADRLGNQVRVNGPIDFETELVPRVKAATDIFVCCHPQGDPSCTYLETLSCGVPIAGFANEAFSGILNTADVGWGVKMNDVAALAKQIEHLNKNRNEIELTARNALAFAGGHTFEATFQRRIDQLKSIAEAYKMNPAKSKR